ncbi:MAG: hypothetical protein ACOC91_03080, partial [bacterium]
RNISVPNRVRVPDAVKPRQALFPAPCLFDAVVHTKFSSAIADREGRKSDSREGAKARSAFPLLRPPLRLLCLRVSDFLFRHEGRTKFSPADVGREG